jgi:PEP-CTERM motif
MNRLATQIVLAAAMLIGGVGRVHGEVILFSTLGPNDAFDMSGGTSFSFSAAPPPLFTDVRFAMLFQVPDGGNSPFSSAVLPLESTGDIASVEIQLLSSSGGNPDSILESILVTSQVSGTPALVTAMSTTFPELQGGGTYFLGVDVRPQLTTSGRWGLSTLSGDPRGPAVEVWSAVNSFPLGVAGPSQVGFTIRGVAVPEPSTLVIVATGLSLILGLCWRRVQA